MLTAIATVGVILLAAATISSWQAFRATRSEVAARRSEELASQRLVAERQAHVEAHQAQQVAMKRLFESYVAQAKASRWSGRPGQRLNAIEAIGKAAELLGTLRLNEDARRELRNEAIAAMTLVDVKARQSWKVRFDTEGSISMSTDLSTFASDDRFAVTPGVSIRRFSDPDTDVLRIPQASATASRNLLSHEGRFVSLFHDPARAATVWDVRLKEKILDIPLRVPAFSPDGQAFAAAQGDGSILIYELPSGRLNQRLPPTGFAVEDVKFSPDGLQLAVAYRHRSEVDIRDVATGDVKRKWSTEAGEIDTVSWHPLGHRLAATGWQRIAVCSLTEEDEAPLMIRAHESLVTGVTFHPTRQLLMSDSWDGTTRIWNALTGDELLQIRGKLVGSDPPGQQLALCRGLDLAVHDLIEPVACDWLCAGRVYNLALHPEGRLLALAMADGVRIWDLWTRRKMAMLPLGHTRGVVFHPREGSLLTAGDVGVQVWPVEMDDQEETLTLGPPRPAVSGATLSGAGQISISASGDTWMIDHATSGLREYKATLIRSGGGSDVQLVVTEPYLHWWPSAPTDGGQRREKQVGSRRMHLGRSERG